MGKRPSFTVGQRPTNGRLSVERLREVLTAATGIDADTFKGSCLLWPSGRPLQTQAVVMFPVDEVKCVQRASLWVEAGDFRLGAWPGELKGQYDRLYSDPHKVDALIALDDRDGWTVNANFQLAYRTARPPQRWYPHRHVDGPTYVRQWVDDLSQGRAGGRRRPQIEDPRFRQWLLDREYAHADELATLDEWIDRLSPKTQFHVRPGVEILRTWRLDEAIARDREGAFVADVRQAINRILSALGEPRIGDLRASAD